MASAAGHPPQHHTSELATPAPGASGSGGASPASSEHELMHAATVTAQNTATGSRLVFMPKAPAELEALRAALRSKAAHMNAGSCAMHDAN
jgi:hypothetical protein